MIRRTILPLLAAAVSGCGGGGAEEQPGGGGAGFQFPPTAVEVAAVESGSMRDVFETIGTIEAVEAVTIVSEIDATVVSLPFREGDEIAQGALIARLDDTELAAILARAAALRDQRAANHERIRRVVEQNAGAQQDLDDAAAALQVAEADVALARARLAKTRIVAPFAGVVGPREVSPGAFVRAGEPITKLAQISQLEVVFSVPERYLADIARGAMVTVSAPAHPGIELTGRIDVVDPMLDPQTRNVRVIARAANPKNLFRPGMSANVKAVLATRDLALTIPSEAVFAEGDTFLAYVVQADSTVGRSVLRLGRRLSDRVEVLEGLEAGALVVRAGHQKVFPGAKVAPVGGAGVGGAPSADASADKAPADGVAPAAAESQAP
jgi:membrane fusion protein (multidrug efflux system)